MVNFKPNPIKVTVDVSANDSVCAKLKVASDIAENYSNVENISEDFMKAHNVTVELSKEGETVGVKQVSADVKTSSATPNVSTPNVSTSDDSGILVDSTGAMLNTSSASCNDGDPARVKEDLSSDDDRILRDDNGYNPLDNFGDIDNDTERRLLDSDGNNDEIYIQSTPISPEKSKPIERKRKTENDDKQIEPKSKVARKTVGKGKKKTLGLARKRTGGAPNYGSRGKLPKFTKLAKSVLKKESPSDAQYSTSSKSDDTDSSDEKEDNTDGASFVDEKEPPKKIISDDDEYTESDIETPKYKLCPKGITLQVCHPLTGQKYIPKEDDDFFSGQWKVAFYFQKMFGKL